MNIEVEDLDMETDGIQNEEVELPEEEAPPEVVDLEEEVEPKEEELKEEEPEKKRKKHNPLDPRLKELLEQKHESLEKAAAASARAELAEEEAKNLREQLEEAKTARVSFADDEVGRLKQERDEAAKDGDIGRAFDIEDRIRKMSAGPEFPEIKKPEPKPERKEVPMSPATQTWLNKNTWFRDPGNAHLAQEALYIEGELRKAGYGFTSEMYETLDKRLSALPEFGSVYEKTKPVVTPPANGGEPPVKPKARQFTDYDLSRMEDTPGLDPDNPKHRAIYLKYKGQ